MKHTTLLPFLSASETRLLPLGTATNLRQKSLYPAEENIGDEAARIEFKEGTLPEVSRQYVANLTGGLTASHMKAFAKIQEWPLSKVYEWCQLPQPEGFKDRFLAWIDNNLLPNKV